MKKKKASPAKKRAAKPAAKKKPAAKASARPAAKRSASGTSGGGTYTPQPIQGMGWAPFRYPL